MGNSHHEEFAVCPSCLRPVAAGDDFCSHCQAPLSTLAVTDPLLSTIARGYAFREAANKRNKPIVLVGIWLIFGPACLVSVFGFFLAIYAAVRFGPDILSIIAGIVSLGFFALTLRILEKITRKQTSPNVDVGTNQAEVHAETDPSSTNRHAPVFSAIRCLSCDTEIPSDSSECPQCGWTFEGDHDVDSSDC